MSFEWKELVQKLAPTIGTALGGPFAGMAVSAISNAVFGEPNKTEEEIEEVLQQGNPESYIKLKQAENEFKIRMRDLGLKEEQLHADDRDSARKREMATKDWMPGIMGTIILLAFLGMVAYVIAYGIKFDAQTGMLVGTLIGMVAAKAEQVCSYYFGSSKGSKDKTAIMALAKGKF